jgi:hypothetical protein
MRCPNRSLGSKFTDGQFRAVWELGTRQHVMGDDGLPIFGLWHVDRESWESTFRRDEPAALMSLAVCNPTSDETRRLFQ